MDALEFPNRITIELTNRCNVSCTFCPRQSVPMELGDMELSLFRKIIDEATGHLPVKLVIFFRGESLLHPHFLENIRYAKEKGIGPIQFASNGLALNHTIADAILEAEVDFISFSLDTLDKNIYQKSRLTGDLDLSIKNVKNLVDKCERRKKEGKNIPIVQVSAIELEIYKKGQQAFIDYWLPIVDIVRIYYEHDEKGHFANPEVQRQLLSDGERKPCRKVFTDFLVYWNGKTALCNYDWNGHIKSMNLKNSTIEEIWNSDEYKDIRKMHNENSFCDGIICKECHHWKIDYAPSGFLGKIYKKKVE